MSGLRSRHPSIAQVVTALARSPYVGALGELAQGSRIGRRRKHPAWVPFAYGALVRHFKSANRLDGELETGLWGELAAAARAAGLEDPGAAPYRYPQHSYWRELMVMDEERRDGLLSTFSTLAIAHARETGLLLPMGKGSLTHPSPQRTIYGDGTVVRPIYRSVPATEEEGEVEGSGDAEVEVADTRIPDAGAPEAMERALVRQDPSAAVFHRHDGPIRGNDFVCFYARGEGPGTRIVLGLDRVERPGQEAETAVALIERIVSLATAGIQAVAYDGALKGVHIDRVMRRVGLVVVNKLAAAVRNDAEAVMKRRPLGTYEHKVGRKRCTHQLHIENGTVVDVTLADDGTPVVVGTAVRRQVKRASRSDGSYRFHLGVTVPCRRGDFDLWLSPHATESDHTLPEHLRLLPPDDPDFKHLYGLRNDSESFNSQFKRTLLVDRAASVGWERQLFDVLGFAVLQNSLTWATAREHCARPALVAVRGERRSA